MKFCRKEADAEERWTEEAKNVRDGQKCDHLNSWNQSIWRPKKVEKRGEINQVFDNNSVDVVRKV